MKRNLALLLSILLITACSDTDIEKPAPLPLIKVAPLNTLLIQNEYSVAADTISLNQSNIGALVSAPVIAIEANVGDVVEAEQVLIRLHCNDIKLRHKQAQAQLDSLSAQTALANIQFERAQRLHRQKSISEAELNSRQAELDAAQAQQHAQTAVTDLAISDVENCILKAPYKAVVMKRFAQLGELASPGVPLMRLMQLDAMEVTAHLVDYEVDSLQQAKTPIFLYKGISFPLSLRSITAAVDSLRRTQEARLSFTDAMPTPGVAGRLVWQDPQSLLPADFISQRDGQLGILFITDRSNETDTPSATVAFHSLPDAQEGQPAKVSLPPTSQVITAGRFSLSIGDRVNIADP